MTAGMISDFLGHFKNSRRKTGNKMNHCKDMKIEIIYPKKKTVIKVNPDLTGYSILRKFFHGMIELP